MSHIIDGIAPIDLVPINNTPIALEAKLYCSPLTKG
jgi:hypothetical protein